MQQQRSAARTSLSVTMVIIYNDDNGAGPSTRSGLSGPRTTTTTNTAGRSNGGGKLATGVNNLIDNLIPINDVSIILDDISNSNSSKSNHGKMVRTRNHQNVTCWKSKEATAILQKQQRRRLNTANRIWNRTMMVAFLVSSSSMLLLRFLRTSDDTGLIYKPSSSVERDITKPMLLPQLDVVPMNVHTHHNDPGVLFVSAFNNNLSMKSSLSSISSRWRFTSARTCQLHQTTQSISPNDRYNCNHGRISQRKVTSCPLMAVTDSDTRDEDENKDSDRTEEKNDAVEEETGDNHISVGSSEGSSSWSNSSSSSSRVEVTPVRRALVNMLIMMTSPFPEIRSALKIRPKQRQRKSQIRNGYAVQTGSGSNTKSTSTISSTSATSTSTTTPRPSFIQRYWKPLAGLLYVCLGVLVYDVLLEKQQHWSMVDAIYFAMTCFTTVGYGDLVPSTYLGKFFTCLYGFTGIALLGALVASIGTKLFHLELDAINSVKIQSQQQVLRFYEKMPHVLERYKQHQKQKKERKKQQREGQPRVNKSNNPTNHQLSSDESRQQEVEAKAGQSRGPFQQAQFRIVWNALKSVASPLAVILSSGMIMGKIEQWNVLDSFYYALVTGTTIGLGDFSPQTRMGKLVAILIIPVLVGATGEILAGIGVALLRRRQRKLFDEQANGSFTIEDIEKMDENHNGQVSKYEYTLYMLLQMDLVTKDEVDDLYEQFSRLDVTKSGYIDAEDLKVMAKLRQEQEQQEL